MSFRREHNQPGRVGPIARHAHQKTLRRRVLLLDWMSCPSGIREREGSILAWFMSSGLSSMIRCAASAVLRFVYLDLDHAKPVRLPPHRLSPAKTEIAKALVREFIEEDLLGPVTSEWGFPIVIVLKPDDDRSALHTDLGKTRPPPKGAF